MSSWVKSIHGDFNVQLSSDAARGLILGLVAIGIALTAISAGWVINNSISRSASEAQEMNLRVAAATLQATRLPELEISYNREGDITRLVAPALPEFSSHEMIDSIGQQTGQTATLFICLRPRTTSFAARPISSNRTAIAPSARRWAKARSTIP